MTKVSLVIGFSADQTETMNVQPKTPMKSSSTRISNQSITNQKKFGVGLMSLGISKVFLGFWRCRFRKTGLDSWPEMISKSNAQDHLR
jgi:hypothetical protein